MKHTLYFLISVFIVACGGISQGGRSQDEAASAQLSRSDQQIADAMVEEHGEEEPVATPAATTLPAHPVITESIAYGELDGQNLRGYLSMPSGTTGPLPGLIVIHEWWGLNDNVKQAAERLAAEGYVTLAVDLYNGKVAEAPKEAMQLSQGLMKQPEPGEKNLVAAYEYLEQTVGSPRIGVIGWCAGGRWSLRTALLLPEKIDASVIYYGNVTDDETQLATLNMPILGLFGAKDPVVKLENVRKFQAAMNRLNKPASIQVYPNANHGFANPSGQAYNALAAEDAWQRTVAFLQENLASE